MAWWRRASETESGAEQAAAPPQAEPAAAGGEARPGETRRERREREEREAAEREAAAAHSAPAPAPAPEPVAAEPTPAPAAVEPEPAVTPEPVAQPVTPEPVIAEPVAAEPVAAEPVAAEPEPVATEPVAAAPVASSSIPADVLAEAVREARQIDGAMGAAVIDATQQAAIAMDGDGSIDLERAGRGNAEMLNAKLETMAKLGLQDRIEDILVTLPSQCHLIRPIDADAGIYVYLVIDSSRTTAALARLRLAKVEQTLKAAL